MQTFPSVIDPVKQWTGCSFNIKRHNRSVKPFFQCNWSCPSFWCLPIFMSRLISLKEYSSLRISKIIRTGNNSLVHFRWKMRIAIYIPSIFTWERISSTVCLMLMGLGSQHLMHGSEKEVLEDGMLAYNQKAIISWKVITIPYHQAKKFSNCRLGKSDIVAQQSTLIRLQLKLKLTKWINSNFMHRICSSVVLKEPSICSFTHN